MDAEARPESQELHPQQALHLNCHKCGKPLSEPGGDCKIDHGAQEELAHSYLEEGENPEHYRCQTCRAIYDGGTRCTYCGDPDPLGTGEFEDEETEYL